MGKTNIGWTNDTWNPVTGCTKISDGCNNCYAETLTKRYPSAFPVSFELMLRPERLDHPLHWRKPRMIFVNSMSDLFHKEIPDDYIARVFDTMERADWHIYQVLTKRSSLMRDFLRRRYGSAPGPRHMWFGVSIEDAVNKTARLRHLQQAPAGVRFLSVEPLLGPIGELDLAGIDWVIVGGESGPRARIMKIEWARDVYTQCRAGHVPFFMKQDSGLYPGRQGRIPADLWIREFPAMVDKLHPGAGARDRH
jgi:protein gp37